MSNRDQATVKSFEEVLSLLLKNSELLQPLPKYATLLALVQQYLPEILLLVKALDSNTGGIAIGKSDLRANIEALTLDMSGKLTSYANDKTDPVMLADIYFTPTDLSRCADLTLVTHTQKVCSTALEHLTDVTAYAITKEAANDLNKLANDFNDKINAPTEGKKDKGDVYMAFKAKVKLMKAVLKNMDKEMLIVRFSAPEFYEHYTKSRKIVVMGTRKMALICALVNALTKDGLQGVLITIVTADNTHTLKMVTKTAAKGGARIKSLADGTYLVTFSKHGFTSQTITVYINSNETTKVNVLLQPL